MDKPKVITLCGSTKFKEDFERVNRELTLQGFIVLSVGCFIHQDDDILLPESAKPALDNLHKRKIDMSDAIYVINKGGYIGESTRSEIIYAHNHEKTIYYMENEYVNFRISDEDLQKSLPPKPVFNSWIERVRYFFRKNDINFKYCRKCGHSLKQVEVVSTMFGWKRILECTNCGHKIEVFDNSKIE